MNKMVKISIGIFSIIAIVYIGGMGVVEISKGDTQIEQDTIIVDTTTFDKQQIIRTKQDVENTGTTQGEMTYEEMLSKEPDFIYYDTAGAKREADSVDAYMEFWYTYLDTNSDGDIDDVINYDMGCGGEVHDSIIEWLDE